MKLKRLLAGFIAVAMTATMIPAMVFADESENAAEETTAVETTEAKEEKKRPAEKKPEAKEEKPEEKPAESKEAEPAETGDKKVEEPAETEDKKAEEPKAEEPAESKEAEPAETKDKEPSESEDKTEPEQPAETAPEAEAEQPDTVTGKTPGESDSSTPKKAPIVIKTIDSDSITLTKERTYILDWTRVEGATQYILKINDTIEEWADTNRFRPLSKIQEAISTGRMKKPSLVDGRYSFKFTIFAYDDNYYLLGKGEKVFYFSESDIAVSEPAVKSISGVKIKDGRLSWKNLTNVTVSEYDVYINGTLVGAYNSCGKKGVNLKPSLNFLINYGRIDKAKNNKYSILLLAMNDENVVGRCSATLTYKTSAKRIQCYTFDSVTQSGGRLNWSAIKAAKYYRLVIWDPHGGDDEISRKITSTSADFNNIIANDVLFEDAPSVISYQLMAYDSSGKEIAYYFGDFNFSVQPNPLSVSGKTAKVKYSKLKKKKQTLAASKVINGTGTGRGPMTYTKVSGHKNISINKKTGKVTIKKKGLKKGTYNVVVTVFAAGNGGYDASTEQTVTFKIKVTK